MNKSLILVVALCLVITYTQQAKKDPCWGQDCTFDAKGDPAQKADVVTAVRLIDQEMKRAYWYYLRGARRLFQANIDTPERFLHFFIYRNIVGTFLAIGSWHHETQVSEVNTFVRLGDGDAGHVPSIKQPVDINPFIISLRLKHGEALIEIDENGNIICNKPEGCDPEIIEIPAGLTEEKVAMCDQYIREHYWHYVRGAKIVHKDSIQTTQRVYAVFTYVNIVGTFLVISSCDADDNVQINTFVRLGAGSANPEDVASVVIGAETKVIAAE